MDITPIYELQSRLRAAAIAGVNLLQEDFRLKRAAEAIKPLESASPVFAKLNQQMTLLLSSDRLCEGYWRKSCTPQQDHSSDEGRTQSVKEAPAACGNPHNVRYGLRGNACGSYF